MCVNPLAKWNIVTMYHNVSWLPVIVGAIFGFPAAGLDNSKSSTAPADPLAPLPSAMEGNSRQVTSVDTGSNPAKSYGVGLGSVELSDRDGRVVKWHREAGEKESVFRRRHKRRGGELSVANYQYSQVYITYLCSELLVANYQCIVRSIIPINHTSAVSC